MSTRGRARPATDLITHPTTPDAAIASPECSPMAAIVRSFVNRPAPHSPTLMITVPGSARFRNTVAVFFRVVLF